MNLDDYSYEFEGRRYLNPQVSLDEQNAFIDTLRELQAQDNAQIARQTYNLGTQVPSNLGGLAGGDSYFKSRYQTPQTNKTIADLRSAAQAQALSTILNNEVAKAEKRYKDAYRAANIRGTNKDNTNDDLLSNLSKLKIETETTSPESIDISKDVVDDNEVWYDEDTGTYRWRSGDSNRALEDLNLSETITIPWMTMPSSVGIEPKNGEIRSYNGRDYIFINNAQYPGVWLRLGEEK